jgi:two-component system chemotaxis response regulator CheB
MRNKVSDGSPYSTADRLRQQRPITPHTATEGGDTPSHLIVIGTSSGGHAAVKEVLRGLSSDLPAAIILMMHMPAMRTEDRGGRYGEWFQNFTRLPVRLIEPDAPVESGVMYVAAPGMTATLHKGRFQIEPHVKDRVLAPINALFESAATEYGNRMIGVILTGLLTDGTMGLRAIHEAGGLTMVQNPETAEFSDMPANAMRDLPVTFCLNVAEIGPALDLLVRRKAGLETGLALSVRLLKERVALLVAMQKQSQRNAETSEYLSTELSLLKRYLRSIQQMLRKI